MHVSPTTVLVKDMVSPSVAPQIPNDFSVKIESATLLGASEGHFGSVQLSSFVIEYDTIIVVVCVLLLLDRPSPDWRVLRRRDCWQNMIMLRIEMKSVFHQRVTIAVRDDISSERDA